MTELMKGHTWSSRKHKMTYPAWVEPKMDEIRCHVIVEPQGVWPVHFMSYAGKPLANLEPWAAKFRELAKNTGYLEFDCGFEANGNFNDSYRWVRSTKKLPEDLAGKPVRFYMFDMPTSKAPFESRMTERHNTYVMGLAIDFDELFIPQGMWVHSEEEVELAFKAYREQGYEGIMVKSLGHLYLRGKRIDGWQKVKPEEDADGVITEIHEAISEDGVPLGRAGSVSIRCEDGSTGTPHGIAHELGADMFNNPDKYVGQWAEFRYMERDRQGGYRHPTWHRLREAKA